MIVEAPSRENTDPFISFQNQYKRSNDIYPEQAGLSPAGFYNWL